ncbi:MAG: NnrU family protein [Proteobacteria bacterium]|nr:NnrU family protein [Pseudomonadota bacterium]
MIILILGLLIFLGAHSVRIFADGWREAQMARFGVNAWKGLFALVSLAGLTLIAIGYGQARLAPIALWSPPMGLRHLASLLILIAFVLIAAAYIPGNRIKAKIGHPMVAGVKGWALAHLLVNGNLADVLLFGSFLAWSVLDYRSARRRDRTAGTVYPVGPLSQDIMAVVAGLVAWVVFAFWLHGWLFNVRPFG